MKKETTPIKKITENIMAGLFQKRRVNEDVVIRAWRAASGKRFDRHTQPTSFKKKHLIVSVDSSGWLYELTIKKNQIMSKLSKTLKDEFKDLRFRIGKIEK